MSASAQMEEGGQGWGAAGWGGRMRTLLILGRVSNLPTVWSNCLAAWMLADRSAIGLADRLTCSRLFLSTAGCSLLYLAGMVLNDAFDVQWDAVHRPERPIPSGRIRRGTVALVGAGLLVGGLLLLAPLSGIWAFALAGTVLLYNAIHKHTWLGLPLMAGCRALIYPAVAVAVPMPHGWFHVTVGALVMAAWVLYISLLAKNESRSGLVARAPSRLLPLPTVPDLLAAIPLVDLMSVARPPGLAYCPFLACTLLALLLRRTIPPS